MSIAAVEREALQFLSTTEPEVLCIRGKWGVGKTYSWKQYLKQAYDKDQLGLTQYAYVSLFGTNSLADLKYAIFENTVRGSQITSTPSYDSLNEFVGSVEGLGRRQGWIIKALSQLFRVSDGLIPGLFLAVQKQVICFDDLERRGNGLALGDVLGLCTYLKEQRSCKVVLILNDEALDDDTRVTFEKYIEKVADRSVRFAPTAEEAIGFALPKTSPIAERIRGHCRTLGITNIRLVQRIERTVRQIQPLLAEFDDEILHQCVHSVVLLTWSVFEPGTPPSVDYIMRRKQYEREKKDVSEQEAAWAALLDAYNFRHMDELDAIVLEGVRAGYFAPAALKAQAAATQKQVRANKGDNSFSAAWELYHDSFDANANEVANAVAQTFAATLQQRSLADASATIALLKDLGRPEQAAALLSAYLDVPGRTRKFFNLAEYPFPELVKDRDVIEALHRKHQSFVELVEGEAAFKAIAERDGWDENQLEAMASLPVDEYVRIFKNNRGELLRKMISRCLRFSTYGNASAPMKEISNRSREALRRIASESPLNARRMAKFGIHPQPPSNTDGAQ